MKRSYMIALALVLSGFFSACEEPGLDASLQSTSSTPQALTTSATAVTATATNPYIGGSGIFMDWAFSNCQVGSSCHPSDAEVAQYVNWTKARGFKYQFMNLTAVDQYGNLPFSKYDNLSNWIRVSRQTDSNQKVIAYVSGGLSNVNDPNDWANIAEVVRTLLTDVGVDGVNLDFEPYRVDNVANYVGLFSKIRSVVGTAAFLSLDYTTDPNYQWAPADFKKISSYFNLIMPMSYDSSCGDAACYQTTIKNVWTYQYQNLAAGVQLFPILPAYKKNRWHNPSVETICNASDALFTLLNQGTIQINNAGVWWRYEWDAVNADTQWTNCWLNR
jgi:hypothetical protein